MGPTNQSIVVHSSNHHQSLEKFKQIHAMSALSNTCLMKEVWKEKLPTCTPNLKKFVNDMAVEVWGMEGCANLSREGGKSPKKHTAPQKPPAAAGKVKASFASLLCDEIPLQ
ncbi:BEN domain-containing protein 5 [Frankliniella fusca]|uniref:BEN domain-containing protein 5 n=1 Tax=Frankliniella fusca TaxID=407009 RepID=A0AAE1H4P3_9NEOP|nr:BEN domain-containing protein 5 [Frankliniella fusca]KAK3928901.1 BEN domain-containing protein 5 [Frankliniella fusca]